MVAIAERLVANEVDMEMLDSGTWTIFEDAYADGKLKFKDYEWIIVEGSEETALPLFMKMTKVDPKRVTCTCCGQHFSIREYDSVFQATGFQRSCQYDKELKSYVEQEDDFVIAHYKTLETFLEEDNVLIIFADGSTNKPID